MRNSDHFKNVTEGLKNIILGLAILIGGGWALFEFDVLKKTENAELELQQLKDKLERKHNITIAIEVDDDALIDTKPFQLLGVAKLHNKGRKYATLHVSPNTITAAKVTFNDDGVISYGETHRYTVETQLADIKYISLLPDASAEVPFIFQLDQAGIYSILFRVEMKPSDYTDAKASKGVDKVSWQQQILVNVGG